MPPQLRAFMEDVSEHTDLVIGGLMAMPPFQTDAELSRPHFAAVRRLAEELAAEWRGRHDFADLSMGTSQDYLVAAEEGATMVRVGRGILDRALTHHPEGRRWPSATSGTALSSTSAWPTRRTTTTTELRRRDRYDDEVERDRDRDRRSPAHDDLERSYRERPNVRRLGPRRRDPDFDDIFAEESPRGRPTPMRSVESRPQPPRCTWWSPRASTTPSRSPTSSRGTIPVILNLQSAETDLAKRLIDFSSGLTYALDGGMQRVADKVFMLTPRNVEVSAEERARLLEKGFFNQY